MIKLIAFDLVGVLAFEKNVKLSKEEEKLEKMFGDKDEEITKLNKAQKIIKKLYNIKNAEIFSQIKKKFKNIKLVIATNHVSLIKNWINANFDKDLIDKIYISAEMGCSKPSPEFFNKILKDYNIKPDEMLFIDDLRRNALGAKILGINSIWLRKGNNLYNKIVDVLES